MRANGGETSAIRSNSCCGAMRANVRAQRSAKPSAAAKGCAAFVSRRSESSTGIEALAFLRAATRTRHLDWIAWHHAPVQPQWRALLQALPLKRWKRANKRRAGKAKQDEAAECYSDDPIAANDGTELHAAQLVVYRQPTPHITVSVAITGCGKSQASACRG